MKKEITGPSNIEERLARHLRFWNREKTDRPLTGCVIVNSYLPAHWFKAGASLLRDNLVITPDMVEVEQYAAECAAMYLSHEAIGQDLFFAAEPYCIIPWLEAISGCRINGSTNSLWAAQWLDDWSQAERIYLADDNQWLEKYREFLTALTSVSQGRFPVAPPFLRGPLDLVSAFRGASRFPMDFYKNPEQIRALIARMGEIYTTVVRGHVETVPAFHEGYSMGGFYQLWAPGKCILFQEDASALASPRFYHDFVQGVDTQISQTYPYSMVHLHTSSSLFILDHLLEIEPLKVIEFDKDIEGPSIQEMLPIFKKVLSEKRLLVWGFLSPEDIMLMMRELPYEGLAICVLAASREEASRMMDGVADA